MAGKLKALDVMRLPPGKHADGGSLYLNVTNTGARSWTYRFDSPLTGKTREMGLGKPPDVSLAEAREARDDARKVLKKERVDPIKKRDDERDAARSTELTAKGLMTFKQAADGWFAKKRGEWDSPRYGGAVESALRRYCSKLNKLAVAEITIDDVEAVLKPIWTKRHPTAIRLRSTIEDIIDWAIARKARTDLNPARWDILKEILQKPSTVHVVKHHAHVLVDEMPAFMEELRRRPSLSARLTEFTILTATRSSEARKAEWKEIDWKTGVWTIPAERMKGRKNKRKSHRVPLNTRAMAILRELQGQKPGEFIFAGFVAGKPLCDAACGKVLELMGRTETLHGFRGSFSSWRRQKMAKEFSRELAELALAHAVGTDVERAYQHDDALDARRPLMEAWCDYCLPSAVRLVNAA